MGDQDTRVTWDPEDGTRVGGEHRPPTPTEVEAQRAENLQRVHQEAHEPTANWIELADDPDGTTGLVPQAAIDAGTEALIHAAFDPPLDKARRVIEAALPHLSADPDVRVDAAYVRGVEAGRGQATPVEYPPSWSFHEIQAERSHRERIASLSEELAFKRGVAIGKAEGEVQAIDGQLMTSGPSDYEVWRDALQLAATRLGRTCERPELIGLAEWFWERLQEVPMQVVSDDTESPDQNEIDHMRDAADPYIDHI